MSYISLYRKYRSQTFGDLMGQEHVVKTLQNAITTQRIAHAYLFTGPRGTGKTSSARLLAKALNAENGPTADPQDDDPICQLISAGNCIDVVEMDAASEAGVENVREAIVDSVQYQPMMCRYKIFIIDEVHDLSAKAFDALLKTIEEPPPHVVFILATTEYNKVPPTIRSRCQKFEFHRASIQDLVSRLQYVADQEGVKIEPGALGAIARMADGGFRDALTLLEQALLTSEGTITLNHVYDQLGLVSDEVVDGLLMAIKEGEVPRIIDLLNEVSRLGRDPRSVLESMLHRLGDLTRAIYGIDIGANSDSAQEASIHETAARIGREELLTLRSAVADSHREIRDISLPRLWLESELIRLATRKQAPGPAKPKQSEESTVAKVEKPPTKPEPKVQVPEAESPKPKPEAKQQPVEEPKAATSAVVETGDPMFDRAVAAWRDSVEKLGATSASMRMKLAESRVESVQDNHVVIEFSRQMELDWINGLPKRLAAVIAEMANRLGDDWTVELGVGKRQSNLGQPQAVELPLEGQKLADTVREIFGTN
ncbi:MAG: DNA polymerase III subunit gamma/tau [Fimbriimonadaceae bacterium]|nr:DNA polymerase III subunit gamma/tau [Fimbriimonadaceae bacterium]